MTNKLVRILRATIVEIRVLFSPSGLDAKEVAFNRDVVYNCNHCGIDHEGQFAVNNTTVLVCPVQRIIEFCGPTDIVVANEEHIRGDGYRACIRGDGYRAYWTVIRPEEGTNQCRAYLPALGRHCKNNRVTGVDYCHLHLNTGSHAEDCGNNVGRIKGSTVGLGL